MRIYNTPISYYWIYELQTAYNDTDAQAVETIQAKAAVYAGNLAIDISKTVKIEGGYTGSNACGFTGITGTTTVNGNVTISNGAGLIFNAGRLTVSGNVDINGGAVEIINGTLEVQ